MLKKSASSVLASLSKLVKHELETCDDGGKKDGFYAAALLGKRRVSARQGWVGEMSGLFEHPAGMFFFIVPHVRNSEVLAC